MPRCLSSFGRIAVPMVLVLLCACSPTHDWRELRPEESGAVALFPCKPSTDARMVTLDGARVRMLLLACPAGNVTWGLAYADVADPSRVASSLAALRSALAANLGAPVEVNGPMNVTGMTPNPQAERVRIRGKLPDGAAVTLEAGFFVRGTRVFQATVMGTKLDAQATATFFDGLKLPT